MGHAPKVRLTTNFPLEETDSNYRSPSWRGPTASFRAFDLPLADMREDGAEMLVLDDRGLRDLPQLFKSGV